MFSLLIVLTLFLHATLIAPKAIHGPLLAQDFPDPSIIEVGQTYYAFSSREHVDGTTVNVPVATSKSLFTGWKELAHDALPNPGIWVDPTNPSVLTPDINQLHDGSFILYYIAIPKNYPQQEHCIGAATSPNVTGPFTPQERPLLCPRTGAQGVGTADPNGFHFENQRYLVFKNASGHDVQHECYIDIEAVGPDGHTPQSVWTILVHSTAEDDNDVEGAALVRNPNGGFVLFFTTGTFNTTTLQIEYATADKLLGPYERQGVLLGSGTYDGIKISGPTGPDFLDGNPNQMSFEAYGEADEHRIRQMYIASLTYHGSKVSLAQ